MGKKDKKNKENRRRTTRAPVRLEARVVCELDRTICGEAQDLSLGGVFVACREQLPVGSPCHVAIIQSGRPAPWLVELDGRVARNTSSGVAIEFTEMDAECYAHVRDVVIHNVKHAEMIEAEYAAHPAVKAAG